MSVAIGIDLGTTNTVIAAVRNGRAVTLGDDNGEKLLPSIVSFHPSKTVLVGQAALERRLLDPENTIFSVKRLIGRNWSTQEVQQARTRFPFDLAQGVKESVLVRARGETYALPEISAFVLRRAKQIAEKALGDEVTHAVITVPANFNDLQRASTKVAGKLAGLEVLRILNEPTAAALAYGQMMGRSERIAIYDLGGGTFDLTVLDLSGAVFEVLATGGDTSLGGDDIDALIADRMADAFMRTHRFDAHSNRESMGRLRIAAEHLKRKLSDESVASVPLDGIAIGDGGRALRLDYTMDREELEELAGPLLGRTLDVAHATLESAGLKETEIDKTIMVGGATRMPLVPNLVQSFFGKPPSQRVNPDEVVALGAAMQAYALAAAKLRTSSGAYSAPGVATGSMSGPMSSTLAGQQVPQSFNNAVAAAPVREEAISASDIVLVNEPPPPPDLPEQISFRRSAPELHFDIIDEEGPTGIVPPQHQGGPPPAPPAPPIGPRGPGMRPVAHTKPFGDISLIGQAPPLPPEAGPQSPFRATPSAPPMPPQSPQSPGQSPFAPKEAPTVRNLGEIAPELGNPSSGKMDAAAPFFRPAPPPQPLLIDVTPLNLNVETVGGYCDMLIAANTPIPCDRTRVFLTSSNNQTQATIRVSQGPARKFADNTYLGEVELTGLTPGMRGEVKIQVTFEIDADGILQVRAKDETTGNQAMAKLRLLGANTDQADVEAMQRRQARMAVG